MEDIKFNYPTLMKENGLKSKQIDDKGFIPKLKSLHKLVDKINEVMDGMNDDDDGNATDSKETLENLVAVAGKYDNELCEMIKNQLKKSSSKSEQESIKFDDVKKDGEKNQQSENHEKPKQSQRRNIWGI
jgi:hypothetical protein